VLGLYFSAHWCPPCRGFTPKLAETYKKVKAKHANFEIIFISSDKDKNAWDEYFKIMPWIALPYEKRSEKEELSKLYKIQGIPSLVLLDVDGSVINKNARTAVDMYPDGKNFPLWDPTSLLKGLIGESFVGKKGSVGKEAIEGKVLGLYFSAHWCPPCRGFTPKLAETYKKVKVKHANFEIIFISSDKDKKTWEEYYGTMPWIALPYEKRSEKEQISSLFGIRGIPSLVLLDVNGSVINKSARSAIGADPEGENFPWYPKKVNDIANSSDGINDYPSLIILAAGLDSKVKNALEAEVTKVAEEVYSEAKANNEEAPIRFFMSNSKDGGPMAQLKKLCSLGDDHGLKAVLLDIPDNGGFYEIQESITADVIRKKLEQFKEKKLERKELKFN